MSVRLNLDPGRGDRGEGWSFVRGQSLRMVICKRPDPPDDHLQKTVSSRWSFARAGSSRWSFASGRIFRMKICHHVIICHLLDAPHDDDGVIYEQSLKCNHICIETNPISFPLLARPTTVWFGNLASPPSWPHPTAFTTFGQFILDCLWIWGANLTQQKLFLFVLLWIFSSNLNG